MNDQHVLNIDYWHDYSTEDTTMTGFPIITTDLPDIEGLCFRCGSAGFEQLLFCSLCCEGIHPFCLEEGELPASQVECMEDAWVCRRCVVCHVCGISGIDQLIQCSVCWRYFHIECVGPNHHYGCEDKMTAWERNLLASFGGSWVEKCIWRPNSPNVSSQMATQDELDIEVIEVMNSAYNQYSFNRMVLLPEIVPESSSEKQPNKSLVKCIRIPDENVDFEEQHSFNICLDDGDNNLENYVNLGMNFSPFDDQDLDDEFKDPCNPIDDEWRALNYSKIVYKEKKSNMSLDYWRKLASIEPFEYLGYPSWEDMIESGLLPPKSRYTVREDEERPESPMSKKRMTMNIRKHQEEMREFIKYQKDWGKREVERFRALRIPFGGKKADKSKEENIPMVESRAHTPPDEYEYYYESYDQSDQCILYDCYEDSSWQPSNWDEFNAIFVDYMSENPKGKEMVDLLISSGKYLRSVIGSGKRKRSRANVNSKKIKLEHNVSLSPRTLKRTIEMAKSSVCSIRLKKMKLEVMENSHEHDLNAGFNTVVDTQYNGDENTKILYPMESPLSKISNIHHYPVDPPCDKVSSIDHFPVNPLPYKIYSIDHYPMDPPLVPNRHDLSLGSKTEVIEIFDDFMDSNTENGTHTDPLFDDHINIEISKNETSQGSNLGLEREDNQSCSYPDKEVLRKRTRVHKPGRPSELASLRKTQTFL